MTHLNKRTRKRLKRDAARARQKAAIARARAGDDDQSSPVSFDVSDPDGQLIHQICERASSMTKLTQREVLAYEMDLTATHLNGCPLDLQKLLEAPEFDFRHDLAGIRDNLNRITGQLENHFLPRCAKPETSDDEQ